MNFIHILVAIAITMLFILSIISIDRQKILFFAIEECVVSGIVVLCAGPLTTALIIVLSIIQMIILYKNEGYTDTKTVLVFLTCISIITLTTFSSPVELSTLTGSVLSIVSFRFSRILVVKWFHTLEPFCWLQFNLVAVNYELLLSTTILCGFSVAVVVRLHIEREKEKIKIPYVK